MKECRLPNNGAESIDAHERVRRDVTYRRNRFLVALKRKLVLSLVLRRWAVTEGTLHSISQ